MKERLRLLTANGTITIAQMALSKLVGAAIKSTKGVAAMSTGLIEGITNSLQGSSFPNGIEIKASSEANGLDIHLKVIVEYGVAMHDIARELQHKVREAIVSLTGLTISEIHIRVDGIVQPKNHTGGFLSRGKAVYGQ